MFRVGEYGAHLAKVSSGSIGGQMNAALRMGLLHRERAIRSSASADVLTSRLKPV